jgi:hypothetical protein
MHAFLVPIFTSLMTRGGFLFRSYKGEPYPPSDEFGGQISTAINGARRRLSKQGTPIVDISAYTARQYLPECSYTSVSNFKVLRWFLSHKSAGTSRTLSRNSLLWLQNNKKPRPFPHSDY